jgi:hypothetical protein
MPTETGRHRLYEKIKEQWGEEHAAELMSYLPPVGWADVATKQDLEALRVATKQDLEALRVATKHDIDELRLATTHDIESLALRLESRIDRALVSYMRWTVGAMIGLTGIFGVLVNWLH